MIKVEEMVAYKAFGLTIISELEFPELSKIGNNVDSTDIEIKVMDLSKKWDQLSGNKKVLVVNENLVMFQIPNTAIFSIENGKTIIVSPFINIDEDLIRLYILGTCMGVILMQRKILPLHGSAVTINGKAYAFIGFSGVGKSTLASAFLREGYPAINR